jgi:hypothetical protein
MYGHEVHAYEVYAHEIRTRRQPSSQILLRENPEQVPPLSVMHQRHHSHLLLFLGKILYGACLL